MIAYIIFAHQSVLYHSVPIFYWHLYFHLQLWFEYWPISWRLRSFEAHLDPWLNHWFPMELNPYRTMDIDPVLSSVSVDAWNRSKWFLFLVHYFDHALIL